MLIFAEKYDRNKEEKRKMKRIISILLYMAVLLPLAAQPPKHEVRAAWITAVYGLDWPQTRTTSPEGIRKQQAELIEILDRLKAANSTQYCSRPVHGEMSFTNQPSSPTTPY